MEILPKGAISEIFGCVSSGKTLVLQELLASSSARGEFCAVVDSRGAFDPLSASRAGVDLRRLLWVRASQRAGHRMDRAFKAADLILHAGGFGVVVLDLCDVPAARPQQYPAVLLVPLPPRGRKHAHQFDRHRRSAAGEILRACAARSEARASAMAWPGFRRHRFQTDSAQGRAIVNQDLLRNGGVSHVRLYICAVL